VKKSYFKKYFILWDLYPWGLNPDRSTSLFFLLLEKHKNFVKIGFSPVIEKKEFYTKKKKIGIRAAWPSPNYKRVGPPKKESRESIATKILRSSKRYGIG